MRYFPLFLDLINKPVLVVGGGEVASRKVEALLKAGADVTIVSPTLVDFLSKLASEHQLRWVQRFYSSDIVTKNFVQVWATTDNPELNHQVYKDAKELGILVNVVDDKPYCDFITPSMINRGRIQIAISSGGASPVLIRNIREKLESILPQNMGLMADFANSKRNS
ncbi:bifunctional precorrin-2 dehydrogenase/sirohydrochlorin ferrochelatase, partial [Vibrio parahaemolyticus]